MRILVIGAGFSGAVIARQLAEAGHDIFVHALEVLVDGDYQMKLSSKTNQ